MTPITRTVAAATLMLAALSAAAAKVTENRDISNVTALALSAPIRVEVTLGERESLVLEGEDAYVAALETTVENGKLRIAIKPGFTTWGGFFNWHDGARAKLTVRRLDAIAISGSGDVYAAELRTDALKIAIAGSGDVIIGGGVVKDLTVSIAGSGDVRTGKMEAERATVSIAGSGDATVWARDTLDVKVSGSGDVRYYGAPRVGSHIAGSGSVKKLGDKPA